MIDAKSEAWQARALYRMGTCANELKQWPLAQQHFDAMTKQFPKFEQISEARYGLGFALQNQNQLDQAIQVYEQVTKETNTETAAKARFMMGECAFAQKKYDVAWQHFLEAALGYPYPEWQALGQFEAARCFIELNMPDKARESLQTVIDKFPKHPRATDAATLLAGIQRAGRPLPEIEKAMEDATAREMGALRSKVRPLAVAGSVTPLVGLLGTVVGMIIAFKTASQAGLGKGEMLAQGIYMALVTTAAGLMIAIPSMLCAAYFIGCVKRSATHHLWKA